MSKYTTEVRFICEEAAGLSESKGFADVNAIIQAAIPKVFSFNFPIYDEQYRNVLCTKILMHYYTREIGEETVGLWKLRLNTRLNEIMPYYNKLYETERLKINPLINVDYTTSHQGKASGENIGTVESNESSKKSEESTITFDKSATQNNTINVTVESTEDKTSDYTKTKDKTIEESGKETTDRDITTDKTSKDSKTDNSTNVVNGESQVKTTGGQTTTKNNLDKYSETPQGAITDLVAGNYLTNARIIDESDNTESEKTENGTSENTTTFDGTSVSDYTGKDTTAEDTTIDTTKNVTDKDKESGGSSDNITQAKSEKKIDNISGNENSTGKNKSSGESTDSATTTENKQMQSTEEYITHVTGAQGINFSRALMEYRETLINIDAKIINELKDLFFLLW